MTYRRYISHFDKHACIRNGICTTQNGKPSNVFYIYRLFNKLLCGQVIRFMYGTWFFKAGRVGTRILSRITVNSPTFQSCYLNPFFKICLSSGLQNGKWLTGHAGVGRLNKGARYWSRSGLHGGDFEHLTPGFAFLQCAYLHSNIRLNYELLVFF